MALTDKDAADARAADAPARAASYGTWLLPAYLGALVLVFIGERVVTTDAMRYAYGGVGVLLAVGTTALRYALAANGAYGEQTMSRLMPSLDVTMVARYAVRTDTPRALREFEQEIG